MRLPRRGLVLLSEGNVSWGRFGAWVRSALCLNSQVIPVAATPLNANWARNRR